LKNFYKVTKKILKRQ